METKKYLVEEGRKIELSKFDTAEDNGISEQELREKLIPETINKLQDLHLKLHAQEEKGILVILQAMDAAGKDEAITYIFSNLTAQGLKVTSFKKPTENELKHDYLWRFNKGMPERGQIGILSRSYYEEVIAPRVHDLLESQPLPDHLIDENIWEMRYRQINDFERYMVENGFPVVKFFFNVSKEEQKKRLLDRMKDPKKNWEFSFSDVEERQHWDDYQKIFEDMLNNTSKNYAPWYILPADDEWYSRYIIAQVMVELLEEINPQFPEISAENQEKLNNAIKELENE